LLKGGGALETTDHLNFDRVAALPLGSDHE
jgi:hypothetical protein